MIAPKTPAERKAAMIVAIFLVVCVVALFTVDRLPLPEGLKQTLKRTLWTGILAALGLVLLGVAAVGIPWTLAAGLAAAAFAAAGGVWALGTIVHAAALKRGRAGGDDDQFCEPGSQEAICLGLEY
jgi:uncharacterized membrane protein YdjX (TVP38/TMEM64 family)